MKNKNIIDFQDIVQLKIVQRPSKVIRSPYVADAIDKNGKTHLVHTPALSLADQCITDSQIFATPTKSINSKTNFTAQSVMLHDNGYGKTIIGANPYTAELIVKKIIQKKLWNPYPKYKICEKKPRHIDYLGDIYLKAEDKYIIMEIKNVICATYNPKLRKADRKYVYLDYNQPYHRSGIYPNGEKTQKYNGESVVSKRSIRQLDQMIKNKHKYHFILVFLVNRDDCSLFKPNWQRDPIYSKKLVEAVNNNIDAHALKVGWESSSCHFMGELDIDLNIW